MSYTSDIPIRSNDDELSAGVPTPRPSPNVAYTEGQKAAVLGRILSAWLMCPGMRLGQLLYVAALGGDEHLSQISDVGLAVAAETWVEEYK